MEPTVGRRPANKCPCLCIPKTAATVKEVQVHVQQSYSDLISPSLITHVSSFPDIVTEKSNLFYSRSENLITNRKYEDDITSTFSKRRLEVSSNSDLHTSQDLRPIISDFFNVTDIIEPTTLVVTESGQLLQECIVCKDFMPKIRAAHKVASEKSSDLLASEKLITTPTSEDLTPATESTEEEIIKEDTFSGQEILPVKEPPIFHANIITVQRIAEVDITRDKYLGTVREYKIQLIDETEDEDKLEETVELYSIDPEETKEESIGPVEEEQVEHIPAGCENYLSVVNNTHNFLDTTFGKAEEACLSKYEVTVPSLPRKPKQKNISWPSIEDFTVEIGRKRILQFIAATFDLKEKWLYKINFIASQSDLSSDFYLYDANFSLPSPCYPVAQVTVCIYFSFEVSRIKPPDCAVHVTFNVEGIREVMVPGEMIVNDEILFRVANSKLSVFRSINF